jgi:hypothetical protein
MSRENVARPPGIRRLWLDPRSVEKGARSRCASRVYRSLALTSLALSHRPNRLGYARPSASRSASRRPPGTTRGTKLSAAGRTQMNLEHPANLDRLDSAFVRDIAPCRSPVTPSATQPAC